MANIGKDQLVRFFLLLLVTRVGSAEQIAIRAGRILPISTDPIENGIVLIEEGKIKSVGDEVVVPSGARVIDAHDGLVMPGLIDAQSCLFVMPSERNNPAEGAPAFTIVDALDPFIERSEEVIAQGVTAVYVAPSGQGVFGGRGAVVRLTGANAPTDLVLKADVTVRACIGLPSDNQSSSLARLDDYADLRETLIATQAYAQRRRRYQQELAKYEKEKAKKSEDEDEKTSEQDKEDEPERPTKPKTEPTHEVLAKVLRKEIPLQIEAHRVADILNALRLAKEFGFSLILDGCTEGYRIAGEIARHKVPVVVGPVSTSFVAMPRLEYRNHSLENAAVLAGRGVQTAVGVSGRGGLQSKHAALSAALAAAHGMDADAALRAITLTPAEIFGVADRIGSLDVGKDADIVIMTGHPFETSSRVNMVLIEGKIVYERKSSP